MACAVIIYLLVKKQVGISQDFPLFTVAMQQISVLVMGLMEALASRYNGGTRQDIVFPLNPSVPLCFDI